MDIFAKIEEFERLTQELLQPEGDTPPENETVEQYTAEHLARRDASAQRMKRLTKLAK